MLDYTEIYEMDDGGDMGSFMGFHVTGHGHHIDEIERFLDRVADEHLYTEDPTEWEATEAWVRAVPIPGTGSHRFVYASRPGPGAKAVTLLQQPWGWERWCIHHPHERATAGWPADRFIDGDEIVSRRLAELAQQIDPHPDVDDLNGGTVYYCPACSTAASERLREAELAARGGDD